MLVGGEFNTMKGQLKYEQESLEHQYTDRQSSTQVLRGQESSLEGIVQAQAARTEQREKVLERTTQEPRILGRRSGIWDASREVR